MFSPSIIINRKKSEKSLSQSEINYIVNGYTSGEITNNEMTDWLHAIFKKGMNYQETMHYTKSMVESGEQLDFSHLGGYIIDKHSTGGVGDKISLILGPALAACGCYIPMLAGRSLEHTGGTIDKLDAIPGFRTSLNLVDFVKNVENVGISIMSQSKEICPADRKIYPLRGVTKTVSSIPLICGSIMSKKIAEGICGLIMDIKVGNGAFMHTIDNAKNLGKVLEEVGKIFGIKVSINYTNMDQPLGNTAGLWCEIIESLECLKGQGPDDVMDVVYHLGINGLKLANISNPKDKLKRVINNGDALDIFKKMVVAQGGDIDVIDNPDIIMPKYKEYIFAEEDGYIGKMHTLNIGNAIILLGAGKLAAKDQLDPTAGITLFKKVGDFVKKGEPLLEIFCSNKEKLKKGKLHMEGSIVLVSAEPKSLCIILDK